MAAYGSGLYSCLDRSACYSIAEGTCSAGIVRSNGWIAGSPGLGRMKARNPLSGLNELSARLGMKGLDL